MKLAIFDADGTLTPQRPGSTAPFAPGMLPGVKERCNEIRAEGWVLAIASNQSTRRSRRDVVAQLRWTQREISASAIRWATTGRRRKPKPAMLRGLMKQFNVSPAETIFVGDQETDRQAAEAAGVEFRWAGEFFNK